MDVTTGSLEKKKVKHEVIFRKYLSRSARAFSTIRAGRKKAVEKMFMRKLPRTSYNNSQNI